MFGAGKEGDEAGHPWEDGAGDSDTSECGVAFCQGEGIEESDNEEQGAISAPGKSTDTQLSASYVRAQWLTFSPWDNSPGGSQ